MKNRKLKRRAIIGSTLATLFGAGAFLKARFLGDPHFRFGEAPDAPHPLAAWPWPGAQTAELHPGLTRFSLKDTPDGTRLELFELDFSKNPDLRLELYCQDEDDDKPFDGKAKVWERGVGQATRHLNEIGRGPILLCFNGLYYGYDSSGPNGTAFPVSPVVLSKKVHYENGENHRWTFGARYRNNKPEFEQRHRPERGEFEKYFDWAAGGAHNLIFDGQPYHLPPLPGQTAIQPEDGKPYSELSKSFAWLRTSRISLGWTKDSQKLYIIFVREPDEEWHSSMALTHGIPLGGGWTLSDLQKFWMALGVWGAVNSDGGNVDQMTFRYPSGGYGLIPPMGTLSYPAGYGPDLAHAPHSGALLYFYVRDQRK